MSDMSKPLSTSVAAAAASVIDAIKRPPPGDPVAKVTNIDRRNAKRVVPMEVLGLGLSRSGTASLRQALFDLGYSDVYHYATIISENLRDAELWEEALKAKYEDQGKPYGRKEWDALLGHCMAVTDTPCFMFYRELLETYPDAKVILTVRDSPEQWHQSFLSTIDPYTRWLTGPTSGVYEYIYRLLTPKGAYWHFNNVRQRHFMYPNFEENGKIFYQGYIEEIQRLVTRERLLIFNVREGWAPLCGFLGKEKPKWEFPKINEREVITKNLAFLYTAMDKIVWRRMWMLGGLTGAVTAGCVALAASRPVNGGP